MNVTAMKRLARARMHEKQPRPIGRFRAEKHWKVSSYLSLSFLVSTRAFSQAGQVVDQRNAQLNEASHRERRKDCGMSLTKYLAWYGTSSGIRISW